MKTGARVRPEKFDSCVFLFTPRRTNRWTRAAIACFVTSWCGRGCFDSRRRVNSTVMRFTLSLMVIILITGAACDPFNLNRAHPSDDSLIANFQKHEGDFDKLVTMSNEDSKV